MYRRIFWNTKIQKNHKHFNCKPIANSRRECAGFFLPKIPHINFNLVTSPVLLASYQKQKNKKKGRCKMDIVKREFQEGVVLYVATGANVIDIDIADDVKGVEIWRDFTMPDTNKSFPSVETLTIKPGVSNISIPNSLFPNVKRVNSESTAFLSGKYLVKTFCEINTLLNTFYQKQGEIIDMTEIDDVVKFAFSGCKADEMDVMAVCDSITSFRQVHPDAFTGSAFSTKPFVNGLKLAGNLVLEVDKTAENIELPDTPYNFVFLETADMSHVKKLTVRHPDACNKLCSRNGIPETIVLKTDEELTFSDIAALAHHNNSKGRLQNFSIIHPDFEEIDGVIYTRDRKTLVACSTSKKHVEVLDGTEEISVTAFMQCNIEEVILPESLKAIGKMAFTNCEMLKSVKFGNGLKVIDNSAFAWCRNLKYVYFSSLPEHINDLLASFSTQHFGYDTLEEAYTVVRCGKKYLYVPRDIARDKYLRNENEIEEEIRYYFLDTDASHMSMLEYGTTRMCRDAVAVAEFSDFGNENAKNHIKKYVKRILPILIDEKNEECISKLIMANIIPDDVLEKLWGTADRENMSVVQAYLLEYINNKKNIEKESQTFQL